MSEPLILNGITFSLLNKWKQGPYVHITFLSTDARGESIRLSAYKSRSELGFWRLFVLTEGITPAYYKGAPILITKEMGLPPKHYPVNGRSSISGIDYIQMTFIHLELQKYFNDNLERLEELSASDASVEFNKYMDPWNPNDPRDKPVGETEEQKYKFVKGIKASINDETRQERIEPFITYANNPQNWCGVAMESRDNNLRIFSKKVEQAFPEPEDPVLVYKDYTFNDASPPDVLSVNGDIYKIKMGNVEGKNVFLYFMRYNLDSQSTLGDIAPLHLKNKIIPVLLTTSDLSTPYGLYSKVVRAGNYICKVLNYTTTSLKSNARSTSTYSVISGIYEKLYPYYTNPKIQALIGAGRKQKTRRSKRSKKPCIHVRH
jgi:hypothetical protein